MRLELIKSNHELIIFVLIIIISFIFALSVHAVYTQPATVPYDGHVNISNVSVVYYGENKYGISLNMTEALAESKYTYVLDKDGVFPVTVAYENLIAIEWYELQNQSRRIGEIENKITIICKKVKCDEK